VTDRSFKGKMSKGRKLENHVRYSIYAPQNAPQLVTVEKLHGPCTYGIYT